MEALYRKHQRHLLNLAYRITGNWDIAADVVQDVFLKLLKDEQALEHIQSPGVWLRKIVINRALDSKRLAWYRLKGALQSRERLSRLFRSEFEEEDLLQHILSHLTARERTVLILRDRQGFSVKEIAVMLKIRESTVRVLSKTARDKFITLYRKELQ